MIYSYQCECGYRRTISASISVGPPARVACVECGEPMQRDWKSDAPFIDTSGCKDHSEIKAEKRVVSAWDRGSPERVEEQFRQHVEGRRREIRDAGGQRGSVRQTHAVPAHLYHGKIKETGDKDYWSDPSNLAKHKDCKVDS